MYDMKLKGKAMTHKNHQNKIKPILDNLEKGTTCDEEMPYQVSETTVDNSSIQLLAYQIYREKGGAALDNWLEAERILRSNIDSFDSS